MSSIYIFIMEKRRERKTIFEKTNKQIKEMFTSLCVVLKKCRSLYTIIEMHLCMSNLLANKENTN
jgi:hypothetical protein